jgi:hypothetical protein
MVGRVRLVAMGVQVVVMALVALGAGHLARASSGSLSHAVVFATLALSLLAHVIVDSSSQAFGGWKLVGGLSGLWLVEGVAIALPLLGTSWTAWLDLEPLTFSHWGLALAGAVLATVAGECVKWTWRPEGP